MKIDKKGFPVSRVYDYTEIVEEYAPELCQKLIAQGVTFTCFPNLVRPGWVMVRARRSERGRTFGPIIGF